MHIFSNQGVKSTKRAFEKIQMSFLYQKMSIESSAKIEFTKRSPNKILGLNDELEQSVGKQPEGGDKLWQFFGPAYT